MRSHFNVHPTPHQSPLGFFFFFFFGMLNLKKFEDVKKKKKKEDVPLVEFMYLVFARMPGESYRRRLGSFVVVVRRLSNAH